MYAIIESGNKQYKVKEGDVINVELLKSLEAGANYTINNVIMVGEGEEVKLGSPFVSGASVETEVVAHGKDKKVIVYKYKPKKGFHKKKGHRQPFTQLKISKING